MLLINYCNLKEVIHFKPCDERSATTIMQYENNCDCFGNKSKGTANTMIVCRLGPPLLEMLIFH